MRTLLEHRTSAGSRKDGQSSAYGMRKGFDVISFASGKGGVGKTLTAVNVAIAAQRMGRKVLILDGDLGLANVDVVLGLQGRYSLNDVLDGRVSMNDVVLPGPLGVKVIPSGSGFSRMANLSFTERLSILDALMDLNVDFDLLVIDTGAGISETVMHLNAAADTTVVVTTPEPHAMTDAYAFIKVMSEQNEQCRLALVTNMSKSRDEGEKVYQRIASVAQKFLDKDVSYYGNVPLDPLVTKAVLQRRAASDESTHTIAGQAWNEIARTLVHDGNRRASYRTQADLWHELISPSERHGRFRAIG